MGLASYYTYGLPTFTVVAIALYLLFTGEWFLCLSFATDFADLAAQARVKLSMSAGSSKRRALMRGPRPESDCALASVSSEQGGMRVHSPGG